MRTRGAPRTRSQARPHGDGYACTDYIRRMELVRSVRWSSYPPLIADRSRVEPAVEELGGVGAVHAAYGGPQW